MSLCIDFDEFLHRVLEDILHREITMTNRVEGIITEVRTKKGAFIKQNLKLSSKRLDWRKSTLRTCPKLVGEDPVGRGKSRSPAEVVTIRLLRERAHSRSIKNCPRSMG